MNSQFLELCPRAVESLSSITHSFWACPLPSRPHFEVLVIRFQGECGYDQASATDGAYMAAMVAAGLYAWQPVAAILDLRALICEGGDELVGALSLHSGHVVGDRPVSFPTLALVSDQNRALLSCLVRDELAEAPEQLLFEDLEDAVLEVEKQVERLYRGVGLVSSPLLAVQ
jgi:hypothetical protein